MAGLVIGVLTAGQGLAAAGTAGAYTCTGTASSPGTLAGTYASVVVSGACVVDAGPAVVTGNLTVTGSGSLAAVFGLDDATGSGNSDLTVHGNVAVASGGSLMLGCYPKIVTGWADGDEGLVSHPSFPCVDDPAKAAPTLSTHDVVDGSVTAHSPLGVVLHNTTVRGNITQAGGGAGLGCVPVGIFKQYVGFPEYSDFEDNQVSGSLSVTGLDTCWFATHRNTVRGNLTVSGNTAGRDSMEVDGNTVLGSQSCQGNSPAVELGDGNGTPDQVAGDASGQCGFGVILPNPAPGLDVDVTPTYQPAAVHLRG
jgi:hypothetical protein